MFYESDEEKTHNADIEQLHTTDIADEPATLVGIALA
jgi:hypothetical protein